MPEFIMVPVPPERVPEVYALLAAPKQSSQSSTTQKSASSAGGEVAWPDDDELRRFYVESSLNMQRFLRLVAERAPETITSVEAGKLLNLPKGAQSVAGMLGAAGRRSSNRHGQGLPWEAWWQPTDDHGGTETVFKMEERIAKVILDAAS